MNLSHNKLVLVLERKMREQPEELKQEPNNSKIPRSQLFKKIMPQPKNLWPKPEWLARTSLQFKSKRSNPSLFFPTGELRVKSVLSKRERLSRQKERQRYHKKKSLSRRLNLSNKYQILLIDTHQHHTI